MKDEKIIVSICCITYNHEKYIRQAIDSFLMQKTNFKYEIIIHDDASTDNTADIIREYEKKYPDIIKPIYQTENQYSKGKKPSYITIKEARGKYIAFCEGDDYWCDENKLQIQVDYMEKNPECSFCFHNAKIYDMKIEDFTKNFLPQSKEQIKYIKNNGIYNLAEIARLDAIPTASYFFRNNHEYPDWYNSAIAGDLCMQLINSYYGYAYYIDKVMSVYRVGTNQSMMDKWGRDSKEDYWKASNLLKGYIKIYENINEFSGYKYKNTFDKMTANVNIQMAFINPEIEFSNVKYKETLKNTDYNIKIKIKFILRIKFKNTYMLLKKIKNIIKK